MNGMGIHVFGCRGHEQGGEDPSVQTCVNRVGEPWFGNNSLDGCKSGYC